MKMKEIKDTTTYKWKTIQFFISLSGISEVQVSDTKDLRCSCEAFSARKKCKHIVFCLNESNENLVYPIRIHEDTPQEFIDNAKKSPEAFRTLLLRYGRILAL
jgi:hypothetical protein